MFGTTRALVASALLLVMAGPTGAGGIAGAYLAARQADMLSDYATASRYYTQALARDPSDPTLLEKAMTAWLGLGDFTRARTVARGIRAHGLQNPIADMLILSEHFANGDHEAVFAGYENGLSAGPLADGLLKAWAHVGTGRMSDAGVAFDAVATGEGTRNFGLLHKAFALALAGDFGGADQILSGAAHGALPVTRTGIIAHAQILSQLGRNADALRLIEQVFGAQPGDPTARRLRGALAAGETVPFSLIRDARGGAAEVFYTIATALRTEASATYTLFYARVAADLRPDHVDALLLSAALLEELGRFGLAIEVYDRVPRNAPSFHIAEMGRAGALEDAGKPDVAIEVLRQLAESHAVLPVVHTALGDTLRRESRFAEAALAYDQAIALYHQPDASHWGAYYARGITRERTGDWELAEADFRQALSLNPSQPFVLNYLGYSLVERRERLDEALEMIERAVEAEPENGFITDSLGWVLYRLGRYDDAAGYMERAAELEPADPVISDHLGDTLWAVGRRREAEFQWRRALSFITGEETEPDPDRINRKLEVGLDRVLEEEGADPLKVASEH